MYPISRLRVALNALVLRFLGLPKPLSLAGPDSSLTLCRMIASSGVQRILLVTDQALLRLGLAEAMLAALRDQGVAAEVFADVVPDPGYDVVLAGVERLRQCRAEAVLAIGGGSPIDCAKAILLSHANRCHPAKLTGLWLYALPRRKCLPFYAVPTTAGTGSEVTIAAVVSDGEAKSKRAIVDPKMVPAMVALDPRLTTGLPRFVTATTGMDALTHAVEAYLSTMASAETSQLARQASTALLRSLPQVLREPGNLQAREDMLVASCMAGLALTRAGLGYVHAFAHQLGGHYHLPHGMANAILLPAVLEFSKPCCADRLAELARAAGIGTDHDGDAKLADAFIAAILTLGAQLQIPDRVAELRRVDFETIIDHAFAEAHGTYGVPRYMSRPEARRLLESLMQ